MSDTNTVEMELPQEVEDVVATSDLLDSTALEIEKLGSVEAELTLRDLLVSDGMTGFKLGGVLATIQGNHFWKNYGEFTSFKDYVTLKVGMEYRKALYLISNYTALVEAEVKWEDFKDIGWSKLKEINRIITKENAKEWLDKARMYTIIQLQVLVKQAMAGTLAADEQVMVDPTTLTSLNFKVHADQKESIKMAIDKAKLEAGTEYDAVALDAICLNYLSGAVVKPAALSDVIKKAGLYAVLEVLDALWPEVAIDVTVPKDGEGVEAEKEMAL